MADNSKNIKTYRLVEIPVNGTGISAGPLCPIKPHQVFVIGDKYKIITRVLEKLYVCKAYIDVVEDLPGECLDIVVMKQISGTTGTIWPLSESDCEFLNIDFEHGLLAFPATYDFKHVL